MPNKIFTKILDDNIRKFVSEFSEISKNLFYDEEKNLFHTGEYGKYREEIIRKLFRNILYEDLTVSEGFLINNVDQHSTQCDIIIYDKKNTPILKDTNKLFIPVETAVGVGEVKSTISKTEFQSALRKLAANKKLKEFADGKIIKRGKSGDFSPQLQHCDQLFSFLICKKLNFKVEKIDFDEIYEGIEVRNRHNLILSIEEGLFHYEFNFKLLTEQEKETYKNNNVDITKEMWVEHPNFLNVKCKNYFSKKIKDNPLQHIRDFIASLHYGIHSATILDVDIRQYYSEVNKNLFEE